MAAHARIDSSSRISRAEAEGWDTTIIKAPSSPGDKAHKHKHRRHRHHRRHRNRGRRIAIIVVCVILALLVAGAAAMAFYVNNLNNSMSLGTDREKIVSALTPVDATATKEANEPFYVLLMGSDTRDLETPVGEATDSLDRSDVLTVMRVSVDDGAISLLSIPRDTPVDDGQGGFMKINAAYGRGGAADTIETVQEFTGLPIAHYAEINDAGLEQLVDAVGGVTVDVPVEINSSTLAGQPIHLDPGVQRLNGAEAMAFSHDRQSYATEHDKNRQSAARQVMKGILDAVKDTPPLELPGVITAAAGCVHTDLSINEMLDILGKMGPNFTMTQGTGPSEGARNPYVNDLWLCYRNPDGWARVLEVFKSGGDISTVSYENDATSVAGAPAEDAQTE